MKKFKRYSWLFDWITAGLLLAFGIIFIFEVKIVLYLLGILFVIFAVSRIMPLLKTTKDKLVKKLSLVELVVEVLAGGYLIYLGTKNDELGKEFGYIVGSVFYIRGFMHFFATSMRGEPNSMISFLFHMLLTTGGVLLIANGDVDSKVASTALAVILILCSVFQIFRGISGYRNYRGTIVSEHETKKIKRDKKVKAKKEAPTSDEIIGNIPTEEQQVDEVNA